MVRKDWIIAILALSTTSSLIWGINQSRLIGNLKANKLKDIKAGDLIIRPTDVSCSDKCREEILGRDENGDFLKAETIEQKKALFDCIGIDCAGQIDFAKFR